LIKTNEYDDVNQSFFSLPSMTPRLKMILVAGFLALLFVIIFSFRVGYQSDGPNSPEENGDDLDLKQAFYDRGKNTLILIRENQWARLNLSEVETTNRDYRRNPSPGNFLHWSAFQNGHFSEDQMQNLEKVAVATRLRASFQPSGIKLADQTPVVIPQNFDGILCMGDRDYGQDRPNWFEDEHTIFNHPTSYKSYILTTRRSLPSRDDGIKFYYYPDFSPAFSFEEPTPILPFELSFAAFCIAVTATASKLPFDKKLKFCYVALGIHVAAYGGYLLFIRMATGLGWGQSPRIVIDPTAFLLSGIVVFVIFVALNFSLNRQVTQ
jgi:hypothetical protein